MSDEQVSTATNPKVLVVYYSFTQQNRKVADVVADRLRERGCKVTTAAIEFTDKRYIERFAVFPLKHRIFDIVRMLPAQLRRATGEIRIPEEAQRGGYDLVCVGSATWWLTTCMPIRSFLKADSTKALLSSTPFGAYVVCRRYWKSNLKSVRRMGAKQGGVWVDGIHFKALGGQIRSLLSLISYLGTGENRSHYLGVPIPKPNLTDDYADKSKAFADQLADRAGATKAA
ncbi:flavodoxin family protein [Angustibacter luteus]|uniref:Flavodoxin family protein n=1 Tax=Angustibacter luteus TaxID=658456 RepID=A0ABW1JBZ2_9ACTN